MLKPTGAGTIEHHPSEATIAPGGIAVKLANYDVDGDSLKPQHEIFLQTEVIPHLMSSANHVWLFGFASRRGAAAHNMQLSRRRVDGVVNYLLHRGVRPSQIQSRAEGERLAFGKKEEDASDRAVGVLVMPRAKDAPPPQQPPPPPPVTDLFNVRLLGLAAAGEIVSPATVTQWLSGAKGSKARDAQDVFIVEILDVAHQLAGYYLYAGKNRANEPYLRNPAHKTRRGALGLSKRMHVSQFEDGMNVFTNRDPDVADIRCSLLTHRGLPPPIAFIPCKPDVETGDGTTGELTLLEVRSIGT
ncbi:MAG TPA: OmpA family protein [Vineibacter sp.]|nr:OmpA family protein [Vineibacter sp.]